MLFAQLALGPFDWVLGSILCQWAWKAVESFRQKKVQKCPKLVQFWKKKGVGLVLGLDCAAQTAPIDAMGQGWMPNLTMLLSHRLIKTAETFRQTWKCAVSGKKKRLFPIQKVSVDFLGRSPTRDRTIPRTRVFKVSLVFTIFLVRGGVVFRARGGPVFAPGG